VYEYLISLEIAGYLLMTPKGSNRSAQGNALGWYVGSFQRGASPIEPISD